MEAWLSSQLPSRPVVAPAWLRPFPLFLIPRDLSATQLHPQRQAPIPARPALPTPHHLGLPPAGQAGEPQSGEGPLPPRLEHQRRYRASRALYPHSPPPLTGVTHRFQARLTSSSCSLAPLRPNRELEAGLGALRHPGRRQEWLELAGVWGQGAKGRGSGRLPAEGRRHHFLSICVWPLGRHFTSLITQPRPSGSRDSHSACLNSPGSQVLRGTAGLALGFRNCNSTPVKPFTTVRGQ